MTKQGLIFVLSEASVPPDTPVWIEGTEFGISYLDIEVCETSGGTHPFAIILSEGTTPEGPINSMAFPRNNRKVIYRDGAEVANG